MPAKRKAASLVTKAKGTATGLRSKGGENKQNGTPNASTNSGKKATSPMPGTTVASDARGMIHSRSAPERTTPTGRKAKGSFLGEGGVLTLGKSRRSRGAPKSSSSGSKLGAPVLANGGTGGQARSNRATREATGTGNSGEGMEDEHENGDAEEESVGDDEGVDEMDESEAEHGGLELETTTPRGKPVATGASRSASSTTRRGSPASFMEGSSDGNDDVVEENLEDSEGEESEQDLQSFKEAFPGMDSEDEDGDGGSGWVGEGSGRDSEGSSNGKEDDDEGDEGLMEVSGGFTTQSCPPAQSVVICLLVRYLCLGG